MSLNVRACVCFMFIDFFFVTFLPYHDFDQYSGFSLLPTVFFFFKSVALWFQALSPIFTFYYYLIILFNQLPSLLWTLQ